MQARPTSGILDRPIRLEPTVALVLCFFIGTSISPIAFAPVGGLVGFALLPVFAPLLPRFLGMRELVALLGLAVVAGIFLTLFAQDTHDSSTSLLVSRVLMVIALIGGVSAVLYSRTVAGSAATAFAYGGGMLVDALMDGPSSINAWRFTYSIPLAILVLAVLSARKSLWAQIAALLALAAVGFVNDSRSNSAMLVLAAVALVWQRVAHAASRRRRRAGNLLGLVLFAAAFFQLMQFSLLEGFFGEVLQEKTESQVDASGSLLLGGRPEAAASFALIRIHPLGLGAGILPTGGDIEAAKESMLSIGYDPENNYVEVFMFGNGIEVHSMLGDFWLWFGLAGLAACAAMVAVTVFGLERQLRTSALTGLLAYLSIRFFWDLFFSPASSSMKTLTLMLPLIAATLAIARRPQASPAVTESFGAPGPRQAEARKGTEGR